jgi:hypothetical protein
MSKPTRIEEQELEQEEALEEDISNEDYGFIIGADGEIKHIFTPNDFYLDPPPTVKKILKVLGISDINMLDFDNDDPTIH